MVYFTHLRAGAHAPEEKKQQSPTGSTEKTEPSIAAQPEVAKTTEEKTSKEQNSETPATPQFLLSTPKEQNSETPATPQFSFTTPDGAFGKTTYAFQTPVWPTFESIPFKAPEFSFGTSVGAQATNPFLAANTDVGASPLGPTPSKFVWGKDIQAPKEPEEQTHASVPSSPSQKVEKQDVKTGEEQEETEFKGKAKLFEFEKNEDGAGSWKERGTGEVKVNTHKESNRSRILMRMETTLRLLLNVAIFEEMILEQPNSKHVQFMGVNSLGEKPVTATFLLRLLDPVAFTAAIDVCKKKKVSAKESK